MSFASNDIFKLIEDAFIQLYKPLVSGLNYYNSVNNTQLVRPALIVTASNAKEQMSPFTGIYEVATELRYEAKLDDTTMILANSKFQEILQVLYYDTKIATRLTTASINAFTCHGIPRISYQELPPDEQERMWIKTIDLRVVCMPS